MRGRFTFDSPTIALLKQFLNKTSSTLLTLTEETLSISDFSHTHLLSLKGMQNEENYSHGLGGILSVDSGRTSPTLKIHATTYTDCLFRSTSSSKSNLSLIFWHNVTLGDTKKTPLVVGPFFSSMDSMSWEEDRKIPVRLHTAQSTICSLRTRLMVCTGAVQCWNGLRGPQAGFVPQCFVVHVPL